MLKINLSLTDLINRKILQKVRKLINSLLGSQSSKESVQKLIIYDCEIIDESDMAKKCDTFFVLMQQPSNLNIFLLPVLI